MNRTRISGEPVGRAEEAEVVRLLLEGHSQHEVARRVNRAQSTISRIAREAGVESPNPVPVEANEGRRHHARQRRVQLREKFLGAIEAQLERDGLTARDVRELSVALGVIHDKALSEEKAELLSETPRAPGPSVKPAPERKKTEEVGTFLEPGPGAPEWLREAFARADEQLRRGEY